MKCNMFFLILLCSFSLRGMNNQEQSHATAQAATDFCVGGTMGLAGATAYQPFLRLKNYLQLKQAAAADAHAVVQAMPQKLLSRQMAAWLFQGYGPNCAGAVPTYAATLASNAAFKKMAAEVSGADESAFGVQLTAAAASGAVGGAFGLPFDFYALVKQQPEHAQKNWRTLYALYPLRQAMTRGLGAMCAREGGFGAYLLAVLPWLQETFKKHEVPYAFLVAGACAGLAGAASTQAVDTIKTLQQKNGTRFVPTFQDAWKNGGFKGLHAGLAPRTACYVLALTAMSSAHGYLKQLVS